MILQFIEEYQIAIYFVGLLTILVCLHIKSKKKPKKKKIPRPNRIPYRGPNS